MSAWISARLASRDSVLIGPRGSTPASSHTVAATRWGSSFASTALTVAFGRSRCARRNWSSIASNVAPFVKSQSSVARGSVSRARIQCRLMSIAAGPLIPKWVNSIAPGWRCSALPLPEASVSVTSTAIPDSVVSACPSGSTSGTSAGTGGTIVCPSACANPYPAPSLPVFGRLFPPVARITARPRKAPFSVSTMNASPSFRTPCTRCPFRTSAPASSAPRTSASSTVFAESVVGNSLPVSSRLSATPSSRKWSIVCSTVNVRSTLATAFFEAPA